MLSKRAVMVKYTKRKQACGDMLEYFQKHPEKLREKRLRDAKRKHAMAAFSDELEKIAGGFLRDVGNTIANTAKNVGSGIVNAPKNAAGVVGDIAKSPTSAWRAGWGHTWSGGSGAKTLMVAGNLLQIPSVLAERDITGRDESKLTRAMRFGGGFAASTLGFARGHMVPSLILGAAGDVAAGAVGRKIDKMRGYKPKPKTDIPSTVPTRPAIVQQAVQE